MAISASCCQPHPGPSRARLGQSWPGASHSRRRLPGTALNCSSQVLAGGLERRPLQSRHLQGWVGQLGAHLYKRVVLPEKGICITTRTLYCTRFLQCPFEAAFKRDRGLCTFPRFPIGSGLKKQDGTLSKRLKKAIKQKQKRNKIASICDGANPWNLHGKRNYFL